MIRVAIAVDLEDMAGSLCHYSAHVAVIDKTGSALSNVNEYI